ncbi:MAG: hypothetical protein MI810_01240 [Flavobacteriales bacterium]|nr:hypothetical protein [Flavobacteriales bacterium]
MNVKRKSKRRRSFLIFTILLLIAGFIYVVSNPSIKNAAIEEINYCQSKAEIKAVWNSHKTELGTDEDFLTAIRDRLTSFDLSDTAISECQSWLPKAPSHLNLIIVPDLSDRIIKYPDQIENDREILQSIWKSFETFAAKKPHSKDQICLTVTDQNQANKRFDEIADALITDLSLTEEKTNREYLNNYRRYKFYGKVDELYAMAKEHPTDADFFSFFEKDLNSYIKKSTFFEGYTNKLIIITDGYITNNEWGIKTETAGLEAEFKQTSTLNERIDILKKHKLNFPPANIDLSETEVLIYGIKGTKGFHEPILDTYWKDWLIRMNAKDIEIIRENFAVKENCKIIDEFIKR